MDEARKLEVSENELEKRLYQIRKDYGIDAGLLFSLLNSSEGARIMNQNLSKHAKRKLQRKLQGSKAVFRKIEEIIVNHRSALQKVPDEYQQSIYSRLTKEQRQVYDSGKWTYEVLEIVSTAQRAYFPSRAPSPAEVQPRVKFDPSGNYRTKWNR